MPLPIRVAPMEIHSLDAVSPMEGTVAIVIFYIATMVVVWYFTKEKT